MRFAKSLKLALNMLLHSRLRSWLTITGIVIGVAAVVAIVALGQGMQQKIQGRLGELGADIITVSPGGGMASRGFMRGGPHEEFEGPSGGGQFSTSVTLTKRDILAIQSIDGIAKIQGTVSARGEVYYLAEKATLSVSGVDPLVWKEMTTSQLESGRWLDAADYHSVIIGSRVANGTFKQPLSLNRMLIIEGKSFKIVGMLKEGGDDRGIIMPIKAARDTFTSLGEDDFNAIVVKVSDVNLIDQVIEEMDTRLMNSRHVAENEKDYSIVSAKAMQENIANMMQSVTLFLGAIAAVSLLVGAIGIANTMFTSVLEKTKEIGIMKSIGAKNVDILMIFILNAGMVGLVGGLFGIAFGSIASGMLPALGLRMMGAGGGGNMMTTAITPQLLLSAVALSVTIGVLAGAIPAYRASKLKPVDALRYE